MKANLRLKMKSHLFLLSVTMMALSWAAAPGDCAEILVPENYATIQEAIDNANYGDTVRVAAGTYMERIVLKAGITVAGAGRDVTFLDGDGRGAIVWVPDTARADNTFLYGFTLQNGYDGTYISDTGADAGIYIDRYGSATIEDNRIASLGNYGIDVGYSPVATVIRGNIIHGNLRYGIAIDQGSPHIEKNVIYGCTWGGIRGLNAYARPSIRNNTLVDNVGEGWAYGAVFENGSSPQVFENNIIAFNGGYGIFVYSNNTLSQPRRVFYNCVYGNGSPNNENLILDPDTSVLADPDLSDRAAHDYSLATSSPCRDAGNPGAQFDDADGSRNDMGAYGGTGVYTGDMTPPLVTSHTPNAGAMNVASTPTIEIRIADDDSGVDIQSLVIDLTGGRIFDGSDQASYPDAVLSGSTGEYTVAYTPSEPFASGEKISVYVNCGDLRSNIMPQFGFAFIIQPYHPRTIHVPDDYDTIQKGVDEARFGDTVWVGIGRFDENVDLKQGVNLHGSGPYLTTLSGQGGSGVIAAKNDCTIQGLTIASGYSYSGIYCWQASPLLLNNLIVSSSDTSSNYGINVSVQSHPEIVNNTIVGFFNGVMIGSGNTPVMRNNIIVSCRSNGIYKSRTGAGPVLAYNNVFGNAKNYTGCSAGTSDISVDPDFLDPETALYTLSATSACIDAGDPDAAYNDLDGSRNDVGAFGGPQQTLVNPTALSAVAAAFGRSACTSCQGDMDADEDIDGADLSTLAHLLEIIASAI
jgi:hypothetical protein